MILVRCFTSLLVLLFLIFPSQMQLLDNVRLWIGRFVNYCVVIL